MDELIDTVVKAASDAKDEDDALDTLDDDERIKQILIDLSSETDSGTNINAARASRMLKLQNDLLDKDIKGTKIKDMLDTNYSDNKIEVTDLKLDTVNEEWKTLTYMNVNNDYEPNVDIVAILNSFSTKTNPVLIVNIEVSVHLS